MGFINFHSYGEFLSIKAILNIRNYWKGPENLLKQACFNGEYFIKKMRGSGIDAKDRLLHKVSMDLILPSLKNTGERKVLSISMGQFVCLIDFWGRGSPECVWDGRNSRIQKKWEPFIINLHQYNFKKIWLITYYQRSPYALGPKGNIIRGDWPKGGKDCRPTFCL